MQKPDVIVIGGGPGGSICSAQLARLGRRVVMLEKAHHPRFHLGESLLPRSLPVLEEVGVLDEVRARFIVKNGAHFHEDATGRTARYAFAEAFEPGHGHAFQVPRDEFDELLFRHAGKCGAELLEGWAVTRVRVSDTGRASGVDVRDPDGAVHAMDADFIVDASGRDALFAHADKRIDKIPSLDQTALFSHWRDVTRDEDDRAGDIQIVCFDAGWFWFIPFKDGRTSVGAVVSRAFIRENAGQSPQEMFLKAVSISKVATRMLANAQQVFDAGATADFSFRVSTLRGDGWIAVGDAGGFIDPLFSTGAHLAMHGALLGAKAIDEALRSGDVSAARFVAWEEECRRGAETFVGAVQAFYSHALMPYLFAEKQHPYLRRAITSLLSGDVFAEDARWVRDLRTRFPAHAPSPS